MAAFPRCTILKKAFFVLEYRLLAVARRKCTTTLYSGCLQVYGCCFLLPPPPATVVDSSCKPIRAVMDRLFYIVNISRQMPYKASCGRSSRGRLSCKRCESRESWG
ncbi:hypothetical protein chiPu_0007590 [Chiloscyllium punctatum]|uniref:Uncharacterized protein n=1 Tax=Chiloscyllium punctatum TaxID=137246 RepID=A0A401SFM1_CHIPU|nr:hypothetical protein [Chiloscyllium punctatum]